MAHPPGLIPGQTASALGAVIETSYPGIGFRSRRRWPVTERSLGDTVTGSGKSAEDALMTKLAGEGPRHGSTLFGRLGDITKRPPMWAVFAGALATTGPKGRQAAFRGGVGYLAGAVAHLPVKVLVDKSRPPGAHRLTMPSSFPSGYCASELAFSIGAAQEVPWLIFPLYGATLPAEWSMVRSHAHYPSDIFAGAAVGIVVALVAQRVWPLQRRLASGDRGASPESVDHQSRGRRPDTRRTK